MAALPAEATLERGRLVLDFSPDHANAAELAAMPEPDAAYKLSYEETPATKLRGELAGMKLKALKVRARDMGVDEELLADADDAFEHCTTDAAASLPNPTGLHAAAGGRRSAALPAWIEGERQRVPAIRAYVSRR